ncbi:MAG: cytochrome P450 [Pseudomonadota bacterium]|nr:cytochrome P450 [Pseudomonadota bacterium]
MSAKISISRQVVKNIINAPKYESYYDFVASDKLTDLDLFTLGQPYDLYKELRENAPVYFHESASYDPEPGFWVATKYEDIKYISSNPKIFSSQYGTGTLITLGEEARRHPKLFRSAVDHMLNLDGELHIGLRKEHMPFFKPDYVSNLNIKVRNEITRLLDNIEKLGECDLVKNISQQLPIFTLSEILGIPESDRHKIAEWMEFLEIAQYIQVEQLKNEAGNTDANFSQEMFDMFNAMVDEMFDYGKFIISKKREHPENDLLSAIGNAELDGHKLTQEFIDGSWLLIIFAGNDTTRNTISGAMKLLTENPNQKKLLLDDFSLMPNFVNEVIRCVSPVIHMRRTTTQETEVGNQKLGVGEKIVMWYGAANRDPEIFENPDAFNILRENSDQHLAFGIGRHTCLGKPIALMQLSELYKQLLSRFPNIHMSGDWKVGPNNFVHTIQEMPIKIA